ncbi:MAG: hypothetical protein Fur0034_08080 [Desulfuromonadia bacterium]
MTDTLFIRLLHHEDKGAALAERIAVLKEGRADGDVHTVDPKSFRQVPNTPFCYWVSERIRRLFKELPPFESEGRTVKQGLATADDFRFVRAWWEVPAEKILDGGQWAVGSGREKDGEEKWTEERIREFQAWCRKRTYEGKRWVPFAKGGEYSPYYADIHLVVNWENEGAEIRNFVDPKTGKTNSRPQNTDYYFRPGLTFRNRPHKLGSFAVLPSGCLFSHVGQAVFIGKSIKHLLAILNTRMTTEFVMLSSGRGQEGSGQTIKFETGLVASLPIPEQASKNTALPVLAIESYTRFLQIDNGSENSHAFTYPNLIQVDGTTLADWAAIYGKQYAETEGELLGIQSEVEEIAFDLYGFTEEERETAGSGKRAVGGGQISESEDDDGESVEEGSADESDESPFESGPTSSSANLPLLTTHLLSWCFGVVFGRWDVRIATDPSLAPKLPDPFDPLPVCPPGMLVGPDGLPAEPNRIVSEEWLRARPDANTLPPEGSVKNPTIPDSEYPLRISWEGVLVDDPGFNGDRPHRDDIVRRVREVFDLLWKDKSHEIEQEACEILGVSDLRDYFRKPAGFFQDHLKRYSKSRRKAPIYWPLSTASGSYTLWLYYHRLNDQTLYMIVNKYVEPKISEVERGIAQIENDLKAASGRDATRLTDRLGEARTFLGELRDLREELLRIAALPYKPDLNDGVIINAAPFHGLFRLRSWAKDTEDCWKKLAKGDYDWAHLAYTIWPDRVRKVCRTDRSIAIAHGLEDLCEVEAPESKKKGGRGRRKKEAAR